MPSVAPTAELHGADVRALRARLQLTRAQFAAVFQLAPSTVQRWESSTRPIHARRDTVAWLATVALMPPEVFDPVRARVQQVFRAGPWPASWGIWTIVDAISPR